MDKRWSLAEKCPPLFANEVGVSPFIAQILWNRGLKTSADAQAFLEPSWKDHLHEPALFRHLHTAMDRVFRALESGERITVHGDYDADGITGSAIVITTLRLIEARSHGEIRDSLVDYYIPHRDKEGYGLRAATVAKLKERGTNLIITVDCGIACVDEIRLAQEQGIDVIVVDHHQFGPSLPECNLIHPGIPGETYPFKSLAAVGVAFKFASALIGEAKRRGLTIPEGFDKWLLDLVAIATVTDMVPLIGENRLLETYGLKVLNRTRRVGLLALIKKAGLELGRISAEDLGFVIGPRLNAAGRMDHGRLALDLLLTEDKSEAERLAEDLETCNRARQEAVKKMMSEAADQISDVKCSMSNVIVLWRREWSPALVGLLAGRFSDHYHRPTIAIGECDGRWIGSGRSIEGYDITAAVTAAGEGILTRYGGHSQACGFCLEDPAKVSIFGERLAKHAEANISEEQLVPTQKIDAKLPLSEVSVKNAESLEALEPFGVDNPRPVFLAEDCRIVSADAIGPESRHLRLSLLDGFGKRVKAIGFKQGERVHELGVCRTVDLVYTVSVDEWKGVKNAECKIIDFRPSD